MSEKNYWIVKREGAYATIRCPYCYEWYEIPNSIEELKCYRHCPWCSGPLFLREEDKNGAGNSPVCK